MKAVVMTAPGSPEVLQLQDLPSPELRSETDLLVRLYAAGINPIDTKIRQRGLFYADALPAILGCDGAGVVVAAGSRVQRFRVGDPVYFCNGGLGGQPGTYAEYAVIDERFVAHKPRSLSFAEAAAVPLVLITAWEALHDRGRIQSGQRVLIQAGAGGVGHIAIQLAKLAGATVCTTVSSPEKAKLVQQFGADQVILYPNDTVVETVLDWSGGQGVDLAFNTVSGTLSQSFAATKIYGDVVTLLAPDPDTDWKIARDRNLRLSYELMLTPMLQGLTQAQQAQAQILQRCADLFDRGDLRLQLQQTLPLAAAAQAHSLLESGSMTGKLALEIAE
ncbi:MAG: zinc-dependent alcohol dehydrogenase family protein [Elainella sp.]